ncbi:17857_t:CDS:2, partial [Racocetra persica]
EIQSGLATELPTEPSLLSVIEEIENKKGEEHWENILLKSMKERVNFLQKQETNFSYVNEEERETNFPFNQLLTTLLQQEIYLFLINNAYQQDNDPLVKSESENILAELSEYRTLKDEASPGEHEGYISDEDFEEICEEKQEAEKITFEVYIEIYFCPSLHPPNISDYIRFCRNFALRKGALVSDIKAKDFFFIHRNHPTLIDKPLYYGIKDDYNYTLSLYKNEVEKQVFEVGDFVELELVEFNN